MTTVKPSLAACLALVWMLGCNLPAPAAVSTSGTAAATTASSASAANTPVPTAAPGPNQYIVVSQLNLWFNGPGCHGGFEAFDCSGKRTTPLEPALGHTYNSADPSVIKQQIDWAADYGVDAFSLEWTTPRGIGTSGSLEPNIDDAFLQAPNLSRIRWCIFYDTVLRMTQDPAVNADLRNGINFDDPRVYKAFVSDIDYLASKYFAQPQYLKIDGRPVIYLYAAWNFHGNYAGAIKEARARARAVGYDVFLVGDVIRADRFDRSLASQFDANTSFTWLVQGGPNYYNMTQAAAGTDRILQDWARQIQGLKVAGRSDTVNLQPGWAPQEDNHLFDPANTVDVLAQSRDEVVAIAQVAARNAQPVGKAQQKFVWENTWNNWPEATTIEPTANSGPKYPGGNYQFDFLEVVREVFGPQLISSPAP